MSIRFLPTNPVGWRRLLICVHDLAVLCVSMPAAVLLRQDFRLPSDQVEPLLYGTGVVALFGSATFVAAGAHQSMWRYIAARDLISVAQLVSLVFLVLSLCWLASTAFYPIPQSVLLIFWLIAFAGLVLSRLFYGYCVNLREAWHHHRMRSRSRRVLIIGDTPGAAAGVKTLHAQARLSLEIVGVISDRVYTGRRFYGTVVLGDIAQLPTILASLKARGRYPHCLIRADRSDDHRAESQLRSAATAVDSDLAVLSLQEVLQSDEWLAPSVQEAPRFDHLMPSVSTYFKMRRFLDFWFACTALLFCAPLLLLISGVGLVTIGTPTFFSQIRAGRHLREFTLHKFRTMHDLTDAAGLLLSDEKRTSRFGRFLRNTRLDELPQFWNVLRGEMALIGPRPLMPRDMPLQEGILRKRYGVRPGLTGWAQVNGGHRLSHDQKMALDLYYIQHASLGLDLKILFLTLRTVAVGEHVNPSAVERAMKHPA